MPGRSRPRLSLPERWPTGDRGKGVGSYRWGGEPMRRRSRKCPDFCVRRERLSPLFTATRGRTGVSRNGDCRGRPLPEGVNGNRRPAAKLPVHGCRRLQSAVRRTLGGKDSSTGTALVHLSIDKSLNVWKRRKTAVARLLGDETRSVQSESGLRRCWSHENWYRRVL